MGLLIRWVRAYQCLSLHITFWRGAAVRLRAAARRRAMTTDARPLLSASHPDRPHRATRSALTPGPSAAGATPTGLTARAGLRRHGGQSSRVHGPLPPAGARARPRLTETRGQCAPARPPRR